MSKLLQRGITAVKALSPERQDLAGQILLEIAEASPVRYKLTSAQIEDIKAAIAEADRGEFASEDEVAEAWRQFDR